MSNENCLIDIACPKCEQEDDFQITATSTFALTDDGTDITGDVEWDDSSRIRCTPCGHEATVADFNTSDQHYRKAAKDQYQDEGSIEIDDNAIVSYSHDHAPNESCTVPGSADAEGAYVAAWVWITASEAEA